MALSLRVRKGRVCCGSGKVITALIGFKVQQALLEIRPGLLNFFCRLQRRHPSDPQDFSSGPAFCQFPVHD
eukprot:1161656-Pelagomonas_calceolata.AAC.11